MEAEGATALGLLAVAGIKSEVLGPDFRRRKNDLYTQNRTRNRTAAPARPLLALKRSKV